MFYPYKIVNFAIKPCWGVFLQHHIKTAFTITFNGDSLSDLNGSVVTMLNNMNVALKTGKQVLKMRERKNGQI